MRLPESTFSRDPVIGTAAHRGNGPFAGDTGKGDRLPQEAGRHGGHLDAPLATKELTLDPAKTEIDIDLPIRLKKTDPGKDPSSLRPGGETGACRGAGIPEERTLDNNEKSRTVLVLDAQINVLYVDGYPRWEYRYLKNELIREPTVNVSTPADYRR